MTVKSRIQELESMNSDRVPIVVYLNDWRNNSGKLSVTIEGVTEYFDTKEDIEKKYSDSKRYFLLFVEYINDWGRGRPVREKQISEYDRFGALKD